MGDHGEPPRRRRPACIPRVDLSMLAPDTQENLRRMLSLGGVVVTPDATVPARWFGFADDPALSADPMMVR